MEELKRRIEWFSLYDHTNIEKHLEKMASNGWMIENIGTRFWRYKKIEPRKLKFSVVYYPKEVNEGTVLSKESKEVKEKITISDDRQNFIDMCSSGGWNYVLNYEKMHIFSTDDENTPPIETDAEIQIECIHKFAKSEIIYSNLFIILFAVMIMAIYGFELSDNIVETLAKGTAHLLFSPALLIFSAYNIIRYLIWYKKAKSRAENGEFTETKRIIRLEILIWLPFYCLCGVLDIFAMLRLEEILAVLGIIASGFILYAVFKLIRKAVNKSERNDNTKEKLKRLTAFILIIAWIASCAGAYILTPKPYRIIQIETGGRINENYKLYNDKGAPLDISDFKETEGKTINRWKDRREVLLIRKTEWNIYPVEKTDPLGLIYTVIDVRFPPIYEKYKNDVLNDHIIFNSKKMDIKSDEFEFYRYFDGDDPTTTFVLCNGKSIADIIFMGWEPSEEELVFAAEKLLNR